MNTGSMLLDIALVFAVAGVVALWVVFTVKVLIRDYFDKRAKYDAKSVRKIVAMLEQELDDIRNNSKTGG